MSASKANISSVDALRHFHLQTINFNEETQQALTRLQIELKHACRYVEFELPAKLKSEHEKWLKILNQSKQEVRQPSKQKSSSEAQQIQRQASVRVRELEERLEKAKQWKQSKANPSNTQQSKATQIQESKTKQSHAKPGKSRQTRAKTKAKKKQSSAKQNQESNALSSKAKR